MIYELADEEDEVKLQLKRVDHLIFVTLKYTRTVDIIKSIIKRLIIAFDAGIVRLLEYHQKKKKIKEIHNVSLVRAKSLLGLYKNNKEIADFVDFYMLLRKLDKTQYTKKEEYRKNVTMVTDFCSVNIPKVNEFYEKTKEFNDFVNKEIELK